MKDWKYFFHVSAIFCAMGHLENMNMFCDNFEQAVAQLGEKLFAFEYLQFNCKKQFVFVKIKKYKSSKYYLVLQS